MGRYKEAEPFHRQALEIRRRVLGEHHPEFADSLNNLAELYRTTNRDAEASRSTGRRSMSIVVVGQHHPRFALMLNNLARLYLKTERFAEAEPLYRQATEMYRQVLGEQHPEFAQSLNNLAWMYYSTGRDAEAEPLYGQAIEILLKVLGPQHPNTETAQANYDALRRKLESSRSGD